MAEKQPQTEHNKPFSPTTKTSMLIIILLTVLVLVLSALAFSFLSDKTITVDSRRINVVVADSSEERYQGLSGRDRLGEHHGMLFSYDSTGIYCMTMRDMNFALDIIWIDSDEKITKIQENISPDTYPEVFCPEQDAKYVLEMNAGSAKKLGLEVGDQARL